MNFKVETFPVSVEELFRFPEWSEHMLKTHDEVRKAGVFKVKVVDETLANVRGSPLHELLAVGHREGLRTLAQRQTVLSHPGIPNLYGHRAMTVQQIEESTGGDMVTDFDDFDAFVAAAMDEKSYATKTNISQMIENDVCQGVEHFFNTVVPSMCVTSAQKTPSHNKSLGTRDRKARSTYLTEMLTRTLAEKEQYIQEAMSKDKRAEVDPIQCPCNGCVGDMKSRSLICNKGVIYGSGIPVTANDNIKIGPHFGLYAMAAASILRLLPFKYPGITSPFLYFGSESSFFPAHVEDFSLFSVNYLHYGQPKVWFVVPPSSVRQMYDALGYEAYGVSTNDASCKNILGHKYMLLTPKYLQDRNIPFTVVVQRAGEGVVLSPNAVHFGFNAGYNCAEAINFGTESWIPYGMVAERCNCLGVGAHLDLTRIITMCQPQYLSAYATCRVPPVQDPEFYECIVRLPPSGPQLHQQGDPTEEPQEEEMDHNCCDDDDPFPHGPNKPVRPKRAKCPQFGCPRVFKSPRKSKMITHVKVMHKNSELALLHELNRLFPITHDRMGKEQCFHCGKGIAGGKSKMKRHLKLGCKKFSNASEKENEAS